MFNAQTFIDNEVTTIHLQGSLDYSSTDHFEDEVSKLDLASIRKIQLDFGSLEFVDSTGIGAILHLTVSLKEKQLEYQMINVSEDIQEIFKIIGLDDLF